MNQVAYKLIVSIPTVKSAKVNFFLILSRMIAQLTMLLIMDGCSPTMPRKNMSWIGLIERLSRMFWPEKLLKCLKKMLISCSKTSLLLWNFSKDIFNLSQLFSTGLKLSLQRLSILNSINFALNNLLFLMNWSSNYQNMWSQSRLLLKTKKSKDYRVYWKCKRKSMMFLTK